MEFKWTKLVELFRAVFNKIVERKPMNAMNASGCIEFLSFLNSLLTVYLAIG